MGEVGWRLGLAVVIRDTLCHFAITSVYENHYSPSRPLCCFHLSAPAPACSTALGFGKKATNETAALPAGLTASLSQDQVVQGLKEALGKGVQQAVSRLGHEGGFLTNLDVKIPMPEKLRTVEKTLRALKQDKLADEFVTTMNHAAEQAVPEAAGVFGDAVKGMSIADAKTILTGTNNAATQYFRRTTETNLYAKFLPIVKQATDQTGVTSAYKQLMEKAEGGEPVRLVRPVAARAPSPWTWTPTSQTRPWTACSKWWLRRRNAFAKTRPPEQLPCCKRCLGQ